MLVDHVAVSHRETINLTAAVAPPGQFRMTSLASAFGRRGVGIHRVTRSTTK